MAERPEATATEALTPKVGELGLINPTLVPHRLEPRFTLTAPGIRRHHVTLPISGAEEIDDEMLFEAADDSGSRFYLPRYRIAELEVGGETRYRLALEETTEGWALTVHLEAYPAPAIELEARELEPLPHELAVLLHHRLTLGDSTAGEKEHELVVEPAADGTLQAQLELPTLTQRDEIYTALTENDYDACFVVRRAVAAAFPVATPEGGAFVISGGVTSLASGAGLRLGEGAESASADLKWKRDGRIRTIEPLGGAEIAALGPIDYAGLDYPQLETVSYSTADLTSTSGIEPDALLQVTPNRSPPGNRGVYIVHPTGVYFAKEIWRIFTQNNAAMPEGSSFNLWIGEPGRNCLVHKARSGTVSRPSLRPGRPPTVGPITGPITGPIVGPITGPITTIGNIKANSTFLAHSALDGNPQAMIFVTPNWAPGGRGGVYNPHHIGVWYYTGTKRWAIFNQDKKPMPDGAAFNVLIVVRSRSAFVHKAAANNIRSHITAINNRLTMGNPEAVLVVTPLWNPGGSRGGVYNDHPIGVWYDGRQWTIFNQDKKPIPQGAAFNVLVLKAGETVFTHTANRDTIQNNQTFLSDSVNPTGSIVDGSSVAVKTVYEEKVKARIVSTDQSLELQWIGYSPADRFVERTTAVDTPDERRPFVFPSDLYPYIFKDVEGVTGGGGLVRHIHHWEGAVHTYFQDLALPTRVYYLPDDFKVARTAEEPRSPYIQIRFTVGDALDDSTVEMSFLALPVTRRERLDVAVEVLGSHIPGGAENLVLEPLLVNDLTFRLGLPRADSTSGFFTEQPDALVNLRDGIRHSLTFSMEEFQSIYDALFGGTSQVFHGQVEVDLGEEEEAVPPINFSARLDDLAGEVLDLRSQEVADQDSIDVTLRNAIESPVRLESLTLAVDSDGTVEELVPDDLELPMELVSGEETSFRIAVSAAEGELVPQISIASSSLTVFPDQEAIWDRIVDSTIRPDYTQVVQVETVADLFAATPEDDSPPLSLILVELRRANGLAVVTVDLRPDRLTAEAALQIPLKDLFVRPSIENGGGDDEEFEYEFRVFPVRGGMRPENVPWRTSKNLQLWILSEHIEPGH